MVARARGGGPAAVVRALTEFVRAHPRDAAAHRALGSAALEAGNLQAGALHLGHAARLRPDSALAQMEWALALYRADRLSEAVSALHAAVGLAPRDDAAHYFLGDFLEKLGQRDEARRHLDRAIALRPSEPDYLMTRGWMGVQSGEPAALAGAEVDFGRALVLDPGRAAARWDLGACRQRRGQWEAARSELRAAVTAGPGLAGAWYALAQAERRLGNAAGAAAALARFRELHAREVRAQQRGFFESQAAAHPASANARYLLGEHYRRQGQAFLAAEQYAAALRLEPGHPQARAHLRELPAAARPGGGGPR